MRVGQGDVHALQGDGMAHLPPVRVDHVGRGGHHGRLAELGHDFPAGEAILRSDGIFAVGKAFLEAIRDAQCFFQAPRAIGVQVDTGIRVGLLDRLYRFQFLLGR